MLLKEIKNNIQSESLKDDELTFLYDFETGFNLKLEKLDILLEKGYKFYDIAEMYLAKKYIDESKWINRNCSNDSVSIEAICSFSDTFSSSPVYAPGLVDDIKKAYELVELDMKQNKELENIFYFPKQQIECIINKSVKIGKKLGFNNIQDIIDTINNFNYNQ